MKLVMSPYLNINNSNSIINKLYSNSVEISEDMKYFLELFKDPVEVEDIKKEIEAENIDEIIEDLLSGGYLIDTNRPEFEQISPIEITNLKLQTICGAQPGKLKNDIQNTNRSIGFIGIPYDLGSAHYEGASNGIKKLRDKSSKYAYLTLDGDGLTKGWFNPKINKHVFKGNTIKDYGDLFMSNNQLFNLAQIKQLSKDISESSIFPIYIGGDHSISLPIIESVAEFYGDIQVLQMDAHNDLGKQRWGVVEHGSFVTNLLANKNVRKVVQLGIRGPQHKIIKHPKLVTKYYKDFDNIVAHLDLDIPTYITIDSDVFDPSIVSGVAYPVSDGWTFNDFQKAIKQLSLLNKVGLDIVEFNPKYDLSEVSIATLSAVLLSVLELLGDYK
ncbi:arginase family protein [Niallia circulans]|uniref:Arginase family protein n=1 Tax=Niallia circulans TaxID=1397 RepID=A0A941GFE6_NIACI|nr:arginase family protein [Niallia circulans]MCB5237666.1 arginase family protein [Niallia circulans]